jgi:two-component system LytT family response regulator
LKASNNYTEVILEKEKPILVSKTLKSFEILLEGTFFMRVHQSYLVNLGKVKELQRTDGGALVLNNDVKIPISRANKLQIKKRLEETWKVV